MRGYGPSSYGDAFADVYDEWYAEVTDVQATVALVGSLVGQDRSGRVLELGVGTGRLAIPLALAGHDVVGIDASQAMLDVFEQRRSELDPLAGGRVTAVRGDMVDDLPDGGFDLVLVAYNTLFNVLDRAAQARCFTEVAARLAPGGHFVVEAIVPDPTAPAGRSVSVRSMATDRVVLSISEHQPEEQRTEGQFVELTEHSGVRLRPWAIRWSTVAELDQMANAAGLALVARHADVGGRPFDDEADTHVSVYRRPA